MDRANGRGGPDVSVGFEYDVGGSVPILEEHVRLTWKATVLG